MKKSLRMAVIGMLTVAAAAQSSIASNNQARSSETLTAYMENDLFEHLDRYYTHGTKFSWISRDLSNYREITSIPHWMQSIIEKVPLVNDPDQQRSVSLSFGQNIYTPEHKEKRKLLKNDRPYAGITYLGLGLHSKNTKHMDTLELGIGIVGRHSYAEDIQTKIHEWTDSEVARGWKNQLRDEPILNVYLERKWRLLQLRNSSGLGLDLIPHTGLAIGNALTGANLGGQVRFGWNVPNDFGTYLIRPGSDSSAPLDDTDPRFFAPLRRFGVHAFFAVDGKAVARNILLDGNTFRDSHSVKKEPFVAEIIGGLGIIIHRIKITYSYVHRTKEFEKQKDAQHFGALALSFTF
ncbi:MAG TPA: lipid A deacylase LpxR family protein [Smithella sp.]|nr:lipid A deacylase LpxR family protein [Smithella sp.]HQN71665.1 lipid A deacylase LpxR family protein [Smithella sp.]